MNWQLQSLLNLALVRHASDAVQQLSRHNTDHGFDPDQPFIERDGIVVDESVPGLPEGHGEGEYHETDRNNNGGDIEVNARHCNASPSRLRTHEEPKYSETPTAKSWYSSPTLSSSN